MMKKLYIKPTTDTTKLASELMVTAWSMKMDGELPGDNIGVGSDTGEGEDVGGDAKSFNVWDVWAEEGEEEE